jgi:hypothetical protein
VREGREAARVLEPHSAGAPLLAGDGCGREAARKLELRLLATRALEPHSAGAPRKRSTCLRWLQKGGSAREGREAAPWLLAVRALGSTVGHVLVAKAEVVRDLRRDWSGLRQASRPTMHEGTGCRCRPSPT